MKKAIVVLFALAVCLSLCACGHMDGTEAAALYPDIVCGWGRDFFGDSFVLSLEKDGTCTILDNPGTWTLDKKASNEEFVELAVKTDQAKYFVRLDRTHGEQFQTLQYVNLLIMDSKQETVVYENSVFNPDRSFISTQSVLQTFPELVGEWGTTYWKEDSVITFRDDGTCTLLQQPGKWCALRTSSMESDVNLYVKLENGNPYHVCFWLDQENDWGYTHGVVDIFDFNNYQKLYPDSDQPANVVNRNQIIHPLEFASIAVGQWTTAESNEPFAIIRDDGTCTIRGADGLWTLDYISYYDEKFRNGWDYCLLAQIDAEEYDIRFSNDGGDDYHMYIMNPYNALSLLEAQTVYKAPIS